MYALMSVQNKFLTAAVFSVGQPNGANCGRLAEVNSHPRVEILFRDHAATLLRECVPVAVNSP
jgi:hypothetical protein